MDPLDGVEVIAVEDEDEILEAVFPYGTVNRRRHPNISEPSDWQLISSDHDAYTRIMEGSKYMRFDIDPEYFKKSRDSKVIVDLIYSSPILPMPLVSEKEEVVTLKFLQGEDRYETSKVNSSFIKFHSQTITSLLEIQLVYGVSSEVLETRTPKEVFDLLIAMLYNPGKLSDFSRLLLRKNMMDELLSLASLLGMAQIKNMIISMMASLLEAYQEIAETYQQTVESIHSSGELNPLAIARVKEIEDREPGEFAMERLLNLVEIFDRHKYYECVVYIFMSLYKSKNDVNEDSEGFIKMLNTPSTFSNVAYSAMNKILTSLVVSEEQERDPYYRASRKRIW